jgi:hypothetical protein
LLMAGVVLSFLTLNRDAGSWTQLAGSILIGGLTYTASLWFFQPDVVADALQIVRGVLKKG